MARLTGGQAIVESLEVGKPASPVVCITGGRGDQYNVQELGTCVQYGVSPAVLVFNDNAWGVSPGSPGGIFGQISGLNIRTLKEQLVVNF
ncbi:MAG TPA: thiamine pyrophosphate-dependent enzyme [Dehalococcoidia bacterium]|nr:thiamine pyrophosphate-dependent enzyme [Dehalococcoidia bacterium]